MTALASTPHAAPGVDPAVAALLAKATAEFRATLDATGAPYTTADVHAVLREQAPAIVASAAEQIFLLLPTHEQGEDEDEAQARFDAVLIAGLNSVKMIIRRCFEEFGPVDEAAFAETWERSERDLLGRLRDLLTAITERGRA